MIDQIGSDNQLADMSKCLARDNKKTLLALIYAVTALPQSAGFEFASFFKSEPCPGLTATGGAL